MKTLRILLFATLKDRAGKNQIDLDLPEDATVAGLKTRIAELYPHLAPHLAHALVAINRQFAFAEDPIPEGAEVALFPPVSGGTESHDEGRLPTILRVSNDPIDLDELLAQITLASTGAAAIFTGMVRGITSRGDPHETLYLEYEAYVPMAEAKMAQVAEEIRARWSTVEGIALVQRIGRLDAGTPTVLIACTAPHRDTGVFEAARYGIDRLKEIVPVWKKEVKPDGMEWVEGAYYPQKGD